MLKPAHFGYCRFLVSFLVPKLCLGTSRTFISKFNLIFSVLLLFSQVQAQTPEKSEHILKNGTRIVTVNIPNANYFSAQIFIRAGSVYETPETNGLHHLLEHLYFRNLDSKDSFGVLDSKFEVLGCVANAFTYREFSRIVVEGPIESLYDAIKYLGDFFRNEFSEQFVKNEIEVIEEEIALQSADLNRVAEWALWEAAFSKSAWSLRTCGDPAKLKEVTKGQLLETARKILTGGNIAVVIAGKFDSRKTIELLTPEFENFPSGNIPSSPPLPEITPLRRSLKSHWKESLIGIGFRASGFDNPEAYFATRIIMEVLCGRFGRFRNAGLDVHFNYDLSESGTLLTLFVREGLANSENLEARTRKILDDLEKNGITKKEFDDAKRYLQAQEKLIAQSPKDIAFLLGLSTLFRKDDVSLSAKKYYSELTLDTVKRFASRFASNNAVFIVWEK
ncbi:MAG TPA: pitrilysin family protein [Fimbriimonadales bacterium]|nr:pitrilysin family protein [Fimbriimonadales bacterium]